MSIVLSKVATPYAEALLDLAISNDSLKETTLDMKVVFRILNQFIEGWEWGSLKKFLKNPLITQGAKRCFFLEVFPGHISDSTLKFLLLLVDRGRVEILDSIAQKFLELSAKQDSIKIAKITSAVPLTEEQQRELAETMKFRVGGKQVKLALKKEPNLIAGFIVEIDSKVIDMSVRGRLKGIQNFLLGV